jgi:hypothetical protein
MTFGQAMAVVSRFGRENDCTSFIEAVIEMENRYHRLNPNEQDAFDTVVSEYEMLAEY